MNHVCEREFDFALILTGLTELKDGLEDALFEAGCDDATLSARNGRFVLTFTRSAESLKSAVLSAIKNVRQAGLHVLRVDHCELVTQSDIARRIERPRQLVHQYIAGVRGPGGFPGPVCNISDLSDDSALWSWCEVANWLWENNLVKEDVLRQAQDVALINAVLDLIQRKKLRPELMEELSSVFADELVENCAE